ncbi:MAG: histidine kinase, partial [Rhodospirillales bacterium]|nr:histidine kinase [Rhodospirillales bacterium]
MPNLFKAAQARASHWGHAAKGCVTALGGLAEHDRLGFVYASPSFAEDLGSIVTFLRETTPVADWVAAIGHGICGPQGEAHDEGVLTMMVADLPPESYRIIEDMRDGAEGFQSRHGAWVEAHQPMLGLVHGDPRDPELPGMLADLAEGSSAYLVGGLAL